MLTCARPKAMIIREILPSGLTLVSEAMPHVRSVAIGVWLKRGSRHETAGQAGISHFIEHIVFKGTRNRDAERIAAELDSIGGHMDAFTAKEYAAFHLKVLDEHLPLAVEILGDIVLNPLFDPIEIAKEKRLIFEELCMFAYTLVLAIEISPAFLERWSAEGKGARAAFARDWLPRMERALPFIIALGLLLPTMHQSSLGSLLLVAQTKVHPLWHTGLLPLLFLLTAFSMGYAIIFFEAIFSAHAFRRPLETKLFALMGTFVAGVIVLFLAVRFSGLFASDRLGLTLRSGVYSFFYWAETLLFAACRN